MVISGVKFRSQGYPGAGRRARPRFLCRRGHYHGSKAGTYQCGGLRRFSKSRGRRRETEVDPDARFPYAKVAVAAAVTGVGAAAYKRYGARTFRRSYGRRLAPAIGKPIPRIRFRPKRRVVRRPILRGFGGRIFRTFPTGPRGIFRRIF